MESKQENNEIESIVDRIISLLDILQIDETTTEISIDNCIRIIGEISKGVSESKTLTKELQNIEPSEKATKIFNITIQVLANQKVYEKLSSDVRDQIAGFSNNAEMVATIAGLIEWTSDKVMTSYDNDNNGAISIREVEDDTVACLTCNNSQCPGGFACYRSDGCCRCCIPLSRFLGNLWGKFFVKVLCCRCSSEEVVYDQARNNAYNSA